jgi:hypothetical protein
MLRLSDLNWPRILFARSAPVLLGIAAGLNVWAIILRFWGPSATTGPGQLVLGISGAAAALGIFALLVPMWFFWFKCDHQPRWRKAVWFFLLLFGFSFGAVPYYAAVYLPAVTRHRQGTPIPAFQARATAALTLKIGLFGKVLIAGWALLFLTVAAIFTFPKGMSHVLHPIADYFVLWPATLLIATFIYGVGLALRMGLRR